MGTGTRSPPVPLLGVGAACYVRGFRPAQTQLDYGV